MAHVRFTPHLKRFFPDLAETTVDAATVGEAVSQLDRKWPGLAGYLLDDAGAIRRHVNIFINNEMVIDRRSLSDAITADARLFVAQALSGG
jgi:hypothetical protein